jgi:hypothetical protein
MNLSDATERFLTSCVQNTEVTTSERSDFERSSCERSPRNEGSPVRVRASAS